MLKKIKEYLFSKENFRHKTCEEVWLEEYEADRLDHPEWFRNSDLASAEHAYKTGINKKVIVAAFGEEITEEAIKNYNIKLFEKDL